MSRRLYLHLSTSRWHGGSFQYEQNALAAGVHLAGQGVPLVVGYEDPEWESMIPANVTKIRIRRPVYLNHLFKALTTLYVPVPVLRMLFRVLDPVAKAIDSVPDAASFFPSQETQLAYLAAVPSLGVVHDLMHRYETSFPEAASRLRRFYRDRHFCLLGTKAAGTCVDSQLGKEQLQHSYGIPEEKIEVLPFSVPPYALESPPDDFDARFQLPAKFLFYPATLWRHKNHACILRAMALLRDIPDLQLVLAGGSGNGEEMVNGLIAELGLGNRIHRVGYVADREMAGFYRRARALVMPSFFGPTNIPPLEAMHHGCPVLVANNYAMPEQCGEAAIGFDPRKPAELAAAIARIWTDDALARRMAENGRARAVDFSAERFKERCASILRTRLGLGDTPSTHRAGDSHRDGIRGALPAEDPNAKVFQFSIPGAFRGSA
jgi:glycosyltransferase involved in cell wall biosynthesis